METNLNMYFLFFLILCAYTGIVEGKEQAETKGPQHSTKSKENAELDLSLCQRDDNQNKDVCNCTYTSGNDPNVRKNIEEIIKVVVWERVAATRESFTEGDYNVGRDVKDAATNIIEQITLITTKIAEQVDTAFKQKLISQSIERMLNKQAAIEKELQKCTIFENDRIKKINELEDKILSLTTNTKQLTDTIGSSDRERHESMETISNKLALLENVNKLEDNNIKLLLNITEKIHETVLKSNREIEILTNDTTATRNDAGVSTLCNVKVPSSVVVKYGIWKEKQTPEMDDLDTFLAIKTGCSYTALEYNKNFEEAAATYAEGGLEWRVAVRSRDNADMGFSWPGDGYSFFIAQKMNTVSRLSRWNPRQSWERATPGLLSADRYTPLYVRIHNGSVTVGNECDSAPFFTQPVSIQPGQQFNRLFKSWSSYGAKFLYGCPARFADLSKK